MARRTSPEKFERRISKVEKEASKLRRFAQELKESEEHYAKLVENSLTGIYIDQDGRIVFANERLAKIYGYPKEELIGIESWKLVHPEDIALTDKRRAKRLRGEQVPSEYEARLLRHYGEKLGKRGRTYLEHIMASGGQMETLVSDLRTWASMGKIVYHFKITSSREIIDRVATDLQHQLAEGNIELMLAQSFPVITCDEERIYQVFQNLLSNAIKFTAAVDKPGIEIGYRDQQDVHQFYVRDNGIGIAPKDHKRIFEMFQQAKRVKDDEGTGLGLAIVQRILTDHGGDVWVDSEKGKGATFYFTLPKNFTHLTSN